MKRFFGMMPSDEVKKSKTYVDSVGLKIRIQAGPNGWAILWADGGATAKDKEDTTENNFKAAYDSATESLGKLKELTSISSGSMGMSTRLDG